MSDSFSHTIACPGCLAPASVNAPEAPSSARLMLSLPDIHCQACIASVESALAAHRGVKVARVNLTLKRALVDASPDVSAETLVTVVRNAGFDAHELDPEALSETETSHAERALLMRVAVAGFASMNVMLLSVAVWSGAADATRDLFHWISAAIALPAVTYAAQPFFVQAWSALRVGRLNMDVPISLAILLALATSLWETALSGKHAYFDAAVMLTFFLLAGRWLEARARRAARSAAEELTALEVPRAFRLTDKGREEEVSVAALSVGDLICVRPGGRVPVDGVITQGRSDIDRSMLTGESVPEVRVEGDRLLAGEINLTGPLTLRAEAVGQDTSLQQMAALVAVAESGRAQYNSLADAAAKLYAPGVHILAFLSFFGWLAWSGDMRVALNIAAAVLIITCPCALGLAVPAVTTAASGRLFSKGLLIKSATALERLAEVDHAVFDKTGTLTMGEPVITNWKDLPIEARAVAAALATASAHPLARAIAAKAEADGVVAAALVDIKELPGYGTIASSDAGEVRMGRPEWIGLEIRSDQLCTALDLGHGRRLAVFFEDKLRPGAADLVADLKHRGVKVTMLTGDRASSAASVAARLGIETWQAGLYPADKVGCVERLRQSGENVLYVGDGLNDTAALAAANVSVSPGTAMDVARAASDIVLLGESIDAVSDALVTARNARARMTENFRIATVYNVLAVPLAVAGFATPLIAALAMSLSSITVSLNALRLKGPT